jgi:hypothetical protein
MFRAEVSLQKCEQQISRPRQDARLASKSLDDVANVKWSKVVLCGRFGCIHGTGTMEWTANALLAHR